MNEKGYVIWLGGAFNEPTVAANRAVSPAANHWQKGLILSLQERGLQIQVISHLPEPIWPKGCGYKKIFQAMYAESIEGKGVNYWNLPFFRQKSLEREYLKVFKKMCKERGKPKAIISYNVYSHSANLGLYAQREFDIPWVCIIADAPGTGNKRDKHDSIIENAAARCFLSWETFLASNKYPKIHIDGGVDVLRFQNSGLDESKNGEKKIVMFAGAMSRWAGVSFLIEGFKYVKDKNVELWICGKGTNSDVEHAVKNDARVKFYGYVNDDLLVNLSKLADVFVNPRPTTIPDNQANFPSKILEYFLYGKPVISTWTAGLSPEYRDVLIVLEEESPQCLAHTIEQTLNWTQEERNRHRELIKKFICENKLWSIQAKKLLEWLKNNVIAV